MRRALVPIAFLVLIGLSVFGVFSVSTRIGDSAAEGARGALMRLSDTTATGYEDGVPIWEFRARTIESAKTEPTTTIIGITSGRAFDEDGELFSLAAARAEYDSRRKTLSIEGGVQIEMRGRNRLECASLVWERKLNLLRSGGAVRVWLGRRATLSGRNLVVNTETEELRMDDVTATLRLRSLEGEMGESGA